MANKTLMARNKAEWDELCYWIELNIFEYEPAQKLQRKACLVLDGLRKGQAVSNNNARTYGEYPINVILLTFKANKLQILNAIKGKDFESEENKMKYVCAIVRDKLNDMYTRFLNSQKSQEKVESVDTSVMEYESAEYQNNKKTIERKNNKFSDLW